MSPGAKGVRELLNAYDWRASPLGPRDDWPACLGCAVTLLVDQPAPMMLLWGRDGLLIYNDAYASFAGPRHPEIFGRAVGEAWPEAADFHDQVIATVMAGETLTFEDRHLVMDRNGGPEDVWLDLDFSPVRGENGKPLGVLGIVTDKTAHVLSERARRDSEDRFRQLADNIAQFAWMASARGTIYWFNRRWLDYTGMSLEQSVGQGWRAALHPEHAEPVLAKMAHCFETGEPWEDTFALRGAEGNYRWFLTRAVPIRDESGRLVRWLGTNTDITEEREHAENNALLAAVVAGSADSIISLALDGTILTWNKGAEQVFGYEASEVIGKSERILFAPNAVSEFDDKFERLRRGERVMRETVRRHKDGRLLDVAINAAPLYDAEGRIFGFSAVARDITARKRAEEGLRVVMRELSHRTKNLLAVILAMVRQTGRTTTSVERFQTELTERVRALSASHDLLVAQDWRGADLHELVRAVLQPFGGAGSKLSIGEHSPRLTVDATAAQNLVLALHELAANASKFGALSTDEGRVGVMWGISTDEHGDSTLEICWLETGGPVVTPPKSKGFGHVVLERVATQALSAKTSYDFDPSGVRWKISIPAKFLVAESGLRMVSRPQA
jgi:PAS domain S-box-containing protein